MSQPISAPPIPGELYITGEIVQDKTLTMQHPLTPEMLELVKSINEPGQATVRLTPPEPITFAAEDDGMVTVIRPRGNRRYKGARRMKDQHIRVTAPGALFYATLTLITLAFGLTVQINPILWQNPFLAVASIPALILGGLFLALALFPKLR